MTSQEENMSHEVSNTASTSTSQNASTQTEVDNRRMQKSNPFAVGELGYRAHENLSRPEIKKIGPILLKEQKHFCKNDCSGASSDAVQFSLRCLTDIIRFQKHLKLNPKQRKTLRKLLEPYKKQVLDLSSTKKHRSIIKKMYRQRGGGVFTSILAAVIPLITSLVRRLIGKRKK